MSRHISKALPGLLAVVTLMAIGSPVPTRGQQASTVQADAAVDAAAVDAEAVRAVDRMAAYLRTLKSFGIKVNSTIETVLPDGQKVQFAGTTNYEVVPPKGLYADVSTDRMHRIFFYDGSRFSMYAPRMGFYTSIAAPGTIRETLDMVYDRYGIPLPLADLFYWGGSPDDVRKPSSAVVLGYARLNGVEADHYAFREPGIDYQLWIQRGARPLPLKMVLTDTSDPERPQYTATMQWTVDAAIDPSRFKFAPPPGAKQIKPVEIGK